jgi:hypothetical protein
MSIQTPLLPVAPFGLPLEGRLLAHRRLLVEILRILPNDRHQHIVDWIDDRTLYQHVAQEPGALPGEGIDLELARADEFQILKGLVCPRVA